MTTYHTTSGQRPSKERAIAVFAHNESVRIVGCLEALRISPLPGNTTCYLIANGCTDDTVEVAKRYARNVSWLKIVELSVGDKSDAWNHFIYHLAISADTYYFTDGDCTIKSGALQQLEDALLEHTEINAASGVPMKSNRSSGVFRREIITSGGLAGNLYALSSDFVRRLRQLSVRLPRGLIGDDSIIGALALWNLDPSTGWVRDRLKVVESAAFQYESILCASLSDPTFYIRRLRRYSLRHFQNQLIKNRIKTYGLAALPSDVETLYIDARAEELIPRRSLLWYYPDRWAVRIIERSRKSNSQ